jgi:hypothetical protein
MSSRARKSPLRRHLRRAALAPIAFVLACGTSGDAQGDGDAGDATELAPFAGWPAEVAVRATGSAFRTSVNRIAVDPSGPVWLLEEERPDGSEPLGAPVLTRYRADGKREQTIRFDEGTLARDVVVHPSGAISVILLAPDGTDGRYRVEIQRRAADGALLRRTLLDDTPGPGENVYYDDDGAHIADLPSPPRLSWSSHASAIADGEALYLLAWTYGAKLYRLGTDHATAWSTQVMPANLGMAYSFLSERLAIDDAGRVLVAYQIFEDDVHIYNEHFRRAPLAPIDSYDVLVERFGADGTPSGAQIFGGPGGDAPTGMVAHADGVVVTGGVRRTKHDLPNRNKEWDLFVVRGSVDRAAPDVYTTIDVARDDFAWGMAEAADGTLYLAGQTDYVQVDTNSIVEEGKGLLLALSPDLQRWTSVVLPGPRDVIVQSIDLFGGGRVAVAGTRNGPLTHTDEAMRFNEGFWGTIRPAAP